MSQSNEDTHTSASFPWLLHASLHFERFKNVGFGHHFKFYKVELIN